MKSNLVRILALATLATSLSAYASAKESKHEDNGRQYDCSGQTKKDKKQKATNPEQNQNEKEFERMLMGIYG